MNFSRAKAFRATSAKKNSLRLLGGLALLGLVLAHLVIGTDPTVLAVALATMAVALYPLWLLGPLNMPSLLVAVTAFRYVGAPLFAKLLMGQPLQSNLHEPLSSFLVVLVGILGYVLAVLLVSLIPTGTAWLPRIHHFTAMRRLTVTSAVLGFTALAVIGKTVNDVAQGQGDTTAGNGVVNFIGNFTTLALIASIAGALMKSKGRKTFDAWVVAILGTIIVLSFIFNTRSALAGALIAYVVTIFAYRGSMRPSLLLLLGAGLALMQLVITPLTLYVRGHVYNATLSQRVEAVTDAFSNWDKVLAAYDEYTTPDIRSRQFYLDYYGSQQSTLERVSEIAHVDVIKNAVDWQDTLGWMDLQEAFERTLPSFLGFEKHNNYSSGDQIFCQLHVNCFYGGRATVPLIAAGYASFGWLGAFLYPLLLATPLILLFNKLAGPSLKNNIWSIFFLIESYWSFSEGGSDGYMVETFRYVPQYIAVLGVINIALGTGKIKLFRSSAAHQLVRVRLAADNQPQHRS